VRLTNRIEGIEGRVNIYKFHDGTSTSNAAKYKDPGHANACPKGKLKAPDSVNWKDKQPDVRQEVD
jgi:hypothetical protein